MERVSQDGPPDVADPDVQDRSDGRDSLFLMTDFRFEGRETSTPMRIRNLSAGGLMAEYCDGLTPGSRVEFHVRGIGWVAGQVAWSAAGRIGVAFDHPIDPLLARKPVGGGGTTPVFVKPILPRGGR